MGRRYCSWVEQAEVTKGSLECTLLSRVRFNRADVNSWTQCWVYKNCLPEDGPFKGAPEPGQLTRHESSWEGSWKQWSDSLCADSITVHYCAVVLTHSFPTLVPSAVLMAASDNPICHNNELSSHSKHAQFFCYLCCSVSLILCAALLSVKGMT